MSLETTKMFREKLATLDRDQLLEIIRKQDPKYISQIKKIEYVFRTKMRHLTWPDGTQVAGRPFTNEELILLIDPPFIYDKEEAKNGFNEEAQRQLHIASDPVLWAKHFLKDRPRAYQTLFLRDPNHRKVMRFGRRLGKTRTMAFFCLWYAYTRQEGKIIVLAPMKTHVGLIYEEVILLAKQNPLIMPRDGTNSGAIYRNVQSPQYQINFTNEATIKFFTTGMKSNSKSDVARGQEADVIILDEMDYMGKEDLVALMAMQQTTSERNKDKKMIFGASTPTGQRSKFYDWNVDKKEKFSAFWFPSMVNPFWDKEMEEQMHNDYPNEQAYRHEIEADWGEDVEGVYPHKYLQVAFTDIPGVPALSGKDEAGNFVPVGGWPYIADKTSARSDFVFGIDWDKYTAGVNIVVLEVCHDDYEIEEFQGKIRLAYREETLKSDFIYTEAVEKVKVLSEIFKPKWIYVDRGAGETQIELLHQHGLDHPETRLHKIVKGIHFASTIEVRDPASKILTKKDIKPFMVDNLYQMLEEQRIKFPAHDEELHLVLMSYVVERMSATGRPVFAAGGNTVDHQHDALILACYAVADNFDELLNPIFATKSQVVSNAAFLPTFELTTSDEVKIAEETWGANKGPVVLSRPMAYNVRRSGNRPLTRKMF